MRRSGDDDGQRIDRSQSESSISVTVSRMGETVVAYTHVHVVVSDCVVRRLAG